MPRLEVSIEVAALRGDLAPTDRRDALPVVGTVTPEGGTEVPFVGWIELLALIQRAVA